MVGGHACQMSKPLDSLLLYVVVGWCCCMLWWVGVVPTISLMSSFLIMSRLVLLTALLRHLISQVVIFLSMGHSGSMSGCQGGDEDGVDELWFLHLVSM